MSRSPVEPDAYQQAFDPHTEYRQTLAQLDQMVENGASWSGHERNCAFLNLGRSRDQGVDFATINGVSGLGLYDDGRAHALTDWDRDGDVDVWTTNRTGPQLRFLRNNSRQTSTRQDGAHFVTVRLVGKQSNRDGIGATVEVVMRAETDLRHRKTLRAGEGFLAQSSKWLHFGLGDEREIESIVVHWPSGRQHTYPSPQVDRFHVFTEGETDPKVLLPTVQAPVVEADLPVAAMPDGEQQATTHVLLTSPIPLPRIPYLNAAEQDETMALHLGRPICVNLFATWCQPCAVELREMASSQTRFAAGGVRVLALSLDGIAGENTIQDQHAMTKPAVSTRADVEPFLRRIGQFELTGFATTETVRRLELLQGLPFGNRPNIQLPTSFLVDAEGRLAAIYRGRVSPDRILADVKSLSLSDSERVRTALPFPGRWYDGRRRYAPLSIVADLLDHNFPTDAAEYCEANLRDLLKQPRFADVSNVLGASLARDVSVARALDFYRILLREQPNNVPLLNNVAWTLATHEDGEIRSGEEAIQWAARAAKLTNWRSPPVLDTLAAAYAEAGDFARAVKTIDDALLIANRAGDESLSNKLRQRRQFYLQRRPFRP